ncbi:MAG: lysophospholipid acyltransferase family protein [Candidatus Omnitrophota bacterium]
MLSYFLYRLGQFIALSLPLKIAYKIANAIADFDYLISPRDRHAVYSNLKAIFPHKHKKEVRRICRTMFRNFAKYLIDFFRFAEINKEYIQRNIKIKNLHYLDEVLAKGKGGIVLTAHIGNWELGGIVLGILGYPFWVVALPHKDKKVNKFFNYQRESKGVKVIPLGRAVRSSITLLKENKLLALVGDREFTKGGMLTDFFGLPTMLPQGPAALALKTHSSIIPGFLVRNPDDTFNLIFEPPIEPKNCSLNELTNQYKIILENYIRKYPEQWYMFRKFQVEEKL